MKLTQNKCLGFEVLKAIIPKQIRYIRIAIPFKVNKHVVEKNNT